MPQPRRDPSEAVGALVAVAPLVSRWIERLLAAHTPAMTSAQFLALRAIGAEQLSGSELARRTGVSGPAVSQLLAGLADAGLIERREQIEDRRRQALALTDAGHRALSSAQRLLNERLSTLLAELPRPEADALARSLPRVEAALSGSPPPRRPPPPRPPHHPQKS
ncbi:MAG TPA: MarR family transcriptional regulator [Solirubrobacteraceae bacterium]|nr:MarR family transcriptional regulator [Solirubrobacteraceae bacterium]